MTAKFISIEGTEGAGKSTALKFIEHYFAEQNIQLVLTREPGGTAFAEELRCLLLHHEHPEKITAETELLLMFAGRAEHIHHVILPALAQHQWVLSDRYIDATYAYQGGGRHLNMHLIQQLDQMIVKNIYPDLTILLDIPVELGMERAQQRHLKKDRIEQESIQFFDRVRAVYLDRAKAESERIKIVDASQNLPAVHQQIKTILDVFLQSTLT